MARLQQSSVIFSDDPELSYMARAFCPSEELSELWHTAIPGVVTRGGVIYVPIDGLGQATKYAKNNKLEVLCNVSEPPVTPTLKHKTAYPYQIEGAQRLLANGRYMLNFEMGLGKTLSTIVALKKAKAQETLIVCPAMVRLSWADELGKWWKKHPEAGLVTMNKSIPDTPIVITSYECLSAALRKRTKFDAIVVDEAHYVMNATANRAQAVRKVCSSPTSHGSIVAFLTATPITNEPLNLHNQLDIMHPGRFGSKGAFASVYCNTVSNEYGQKYHGLNETHAEDLAARLQHVALRVTKHEVSHLMPPFIVTPIRIRPRARFNVRDLTNQLSRTDRHNAKVDRIIGLFGNEKRDHSVEWAARAANGGERVCVLTWLRSTARNIAVELERGNRTGLQILHFDGAMSVEKRRAVIEQALSRPRSILVCTMASVKEGINTMAGFDNALLAELYYTPGMMIQVLGRFHRLSGACNVAILSIEGSWEEIISFRLQEKIRASGMLQKSAVAEEALNGALDEDEDEAFESLRKVAAEMVEEDVYA